jgi:hypothetical protein
MGRPPIGKTKMSGAERTRRYRAKLRAAHSPPVTASPASDGCAWCGRSGGTLVGERGMICAKCIEEAHVAIAEARAAKRRAALIPREDEAESVADKP